MPALLTTASMRPKLSIAAWTIDAAAASSETSANAATASPPASRIASTTSCAGSDDEPEPSRFTP